MGFEMYRDVRDKHLTLKISCIMNRKLNFSPGISSIFVVWLKRFPAREEGLRMPGCLNTERREVKGLRICTGIPVRRRTLKEVVIRLLMQTARFSHSENCLNLNIICAKQYNNVAIVFSPCIRS
jgi:hypothetical protein